MREAIMAMIPIADRYIMNDGFISDDTINMIYDFLLSGYDPVQHLGLLKNILEDAVDEALELYA